jgi:hypothetical protein
MKMILMVFTALTMLSAMALADFDLGDLPPCYPTFYGNPAHTMSGKAWLGDCITQEDDPYPVNGDPCDDGVQYLGLPWWPCTAVQVVVTVHAGPNYDNNPLWLNGWKDGNLDGDFCDTLCDGLADEWIVQDVPVTPGTFTFTFIDPGVFDLGTYPGVFRWRLTGRSLGREGFGMYDPFDCPEMPVCGDFLADSLGEVEDYWIPDAQLQVAMNGFDAVPGDSRVILNWSTASETSNDRFEILRDGNLVQTVPSQGNTATGYSYSWTDNGLVNGTPYTYTLIAVDVANEREVVGTASATPAANVTTVTEYALRQNYPNPFNPSTSITFDLLESGNVSLRVYNMIGQEVATLVNGSLVTGRYTVNFDAGNLPSGLYLYRLEANGFTDQKKMLLIK